LIGSIIGSGIFVKPAIVAKSLPSTGWILVCWVVAGLLTLVGSLVFAELGSFYPGAGGQYTYLRESFGKLTAFLFGWTNLLIINSASIAALAVISARYFFNLLPEGSRPLPESHWFKTVPVVLIIALTAANAVGVRWGAAIQNTLTVLKLGALGFIIFGVVLPGSARGSNFSPFWEIRGNPSTEGIWKGFKDAFLAIFWAYDGWYLLSFSGGEIKNPRRNIPLGFILGILVVITVYVAANVAYFSVMSLEEMKQVTRQGGVAAEIAARLYPVVGLTLISIGIMGSTLGAANGNILTGPRLSFAMARDGLFFRSFGNLHPRYLTPVLAIVAQGVLGAVYVYAGSFDQLTDSVIFAAWIFYFLTIVACFPLRRRHCHREDVFLAPGYPALPMGFILFAVAFLAYSFWDSVRLARSYFANPADKEAADGVYLIVSAMIILAGIPVYWLLRFTRRTQLPGA
jgi:amino acid transporter